MCNIRNVWFFIILSAILPNCGRVIDWGKSNFYQGEELTSFTQEVKPYLQSVTIYDQLETKATFDVLWLNDQVRTAYVNLHVLRQGKNEEKVNVLLRRQLAENNHYITYYVLSTHDVKLGVPESHWSFFLLVDGKEFYPFEIKEIELPYEYQVFFGKKFNRFKVPYILRFKIDTDDEHGIEIDKIQQLALIARSAYKEHIFTWNSAPDESLVTDTPKKEQRVSKRLRKKKKGTA